MSPADRSNDLDQDRHLMTTPTRDPQSRCVPSAGSRPAATGACSNIQIVCINIVQQSSSFKPHHPLTRARDRRLPSSCIAQPPTQPHHPRRSNPHSAPHRRHPISRGFLPWRFSDAGRPCLWHRSSAAGIRKPSQFLPRLLYPRNRTLIGAGGTAEMCHKQTYILQQIASCIRSLCRLAAAESS